MDQNSDKFNLKSNYSKGEIKDFNNTRDETNSGVYTKSSISGEKEPTAVA